VTGEYNSADRSGTDATFGSWTKTLKYVPFLVDVSGMAEGYGLHFDLYNEKAYTTARGNNPAGDIDADDFAPFSHDASSGTKREGPGTLSVPDGGTTAALLASES